MHERDYFEGLVSGKDSSDGRNVRAGRGGHEQQAAPGRKYAHGQRFPVIAVRRFFGQFRYGHRVATQAFRFGGYGQFGDDFRIARRNFERAGSDDLSVFGKGYGNPAPAEALRPDPHLDRKFGPRIGYLIGKHALYPHVLPPQGIACDGRKHRRRIAFGHVQRVAARIVLAVGHKHYGAQVIVSPALLDRNEGLRDIRPKSRQPKRICVETSERSPLDVRPEAHVPHLGSLRRGGRMPEQVPNARLRPGKRRVRGGRKAQTGAVVKEHDDNGFPFVLSDKAQHGIEQKEQNKKERAEPQRAKRNSLAPGQRRRRAAIEPCGGPARCKQGRRKQPWIYAEGKRHGAQGSGCSLKIGHDQPANPRQKAAEQQRPLPAPDPPPEPENRP